MPPLRFEQRHQTGGEILDGDLVVAEIRDLHLSQARCAPDKAPLFGTDVPVPLYWQQYAHHQDPERNAGSYGRVECISSSDSEVTVVCEGANASRAIQSRYALTIRRHQDRGGYAYQCRARMIVESGASWHVTPNPIHGEVEFLNIWPHLAFTTDRSSRKRYQGCYVQRGHSTSVIPHHHLESDDKRDIALARGNRFLWLLEDENLVVEILSDREVTAGVCAYMWDAHFGYRACMDLRECDLKGGSRFESEFLVYSIDRSAGEEIKRKGGKRAAADIGSTPIYVHGLNRFSETLERFLPNVQDVWPWSQEVVQGDRDDIRFSVDHHCGYDDHASVRIDASSPALARWCATTLGPAFGGHPFKDGRRYRLAAVVRCSELQGDAAIALRLHCPGKGSVFALETYEVFSSARVTVGKHEWMECSVITPAISPAPDRMHILLEHNGVGTTWFDNVLFEELA